MNSRISDKVISVPLVDQYRDTKDKSWASKTCGICAIKMLMAFSDKKLSDLKVMNLVKEATKSGGFIGGVGWRHNALVSVAGKYGVHLDFKKEFSKTAKDKAKDIRFIEKNIASGLPVIVSIFYGLDHSRGGHLVVINGTRKNGEHVAGYFIQDPDHNFRGNNYYITKEEFINAWRGGMIWFVG